MLHKSNVILIDANLTTVTEEFKPNFKYSKHASTKFVLIIEILVQSIKHPIQIVGLNSGDPKKRGGICNNGVSLVDK